MQCLGYLHRVQTVHAGKSRFRYTVQICVCIVLIEQLFITLVEKVFEVFLLFSCVH